MDNRVDQFLSDNNLTQYKENFIHFDFESFINLRPETISALIPNKSDSAKLHKEIVSFINESDDIETVYVKTEDNSTLVVDDDDDDIYEISTEESILPDCVKLIPIEKRKSEVLIESKHPELTITKMPRIENAVSLNTKITQEPEDIEIIEMLSDTDEEEYHEDFQEDDDSNDVMEITDETSTADVRKANRQKYNFNKIVKNLKLKEIRDLDMQILFAIYDRIGNFNDRERILLSEIVIKQVLIDDTTILIRKHGFHRLAKLIVETFPAETIKPYFRDISSFNQPLSCIERGSLYTAFTKYQAILARSGFAIAKPPKPRAGRTIKSVQEPVAKPVPKTATFLNLASACLTFDKLLETEFIDCRKERLKIVEYLQAKGKFSTVRYVQKHKVLQTINGYELIIQDAHHIYPSLNGFVPKFGKIAHNIIQHAKELIWNDEYVIELLKFAKPNISEDNTKLLAILLLPYVLPKAAIKKNDQSTTVSRLTSAVQFIRLFKNAADETNVYEKLYLEDAKFIMGVLDVNLKMFGDFDSIKRIVLKVGVTTYQFSDPLQAIEAYFKMFLGLHLSYPLYAHHIFDFFGWIAFDLQRPTSVYDIYQSVLSYYTKFTGITTDTD